MTKAQMAELKVRTEATTAMSPVSSELPFAMPCPDTSGPGLCGDVGVSACDAVVAVLRMTLLAAEAAVALAAVSADDAGVDFAMLVVVDLLGLAVVVLGVVLPPVVTGAAADATEDNLRPGMRGCVSRAGRSDAWKRICRAGPTVKEVSSALLVAPHMPPRKSVVSLVQDWPLFVQSDGWFLVGVSVPPLDV